MIVNGSVLNEDAQGHSPPPLPPFFFLSNYAAILLIGSVLSTSVRAAVSTNMAAACVIDEPCD